MSDGFLGRWSRRKQAIREGLPVEEPARAAVAVPQASQDRMPVEAEPRQAEPAPAAPATAEPAAPPPTLDDVQGLTRESDYAPFVSREVEPEVRNAAMKKLFFSDPHFNTIDWMDVYMEDYSVASPLPKSMLRQMASAKFMNLVEEKPGEGQSLARPEDSHRPPAGQERAQDAAPVASHTELPAGQPATSEEDHDHTDLRLQQDHAAGAQGSGGGA